MVENEVRAIFAKVYNLSEPADQVGPDEPLFGPDSQYGLDSLDTLRLISALQERYHFDVAACEVDTFRSIRSITGFVAG
jgi:acyl carrier protein